MTDAEKAAEAHVRSLRAVCPEIYPSQLEHARTDFLAGYAAAQTWRPIESAPRDWRSDGTGQPILLRLPRVGALKDKRMRNVYEGLWNETQNTWTSVNGAILLSAADGWLPLPPSE